MFFSSTVNLSIATTNHFTEFHILIINPYKMIFINVLVQHATNLRLLLVTLQQPDNEFQNQHVIS